MNLVSLGLRSRTSQGQDVNPFQNGMPSVKKAICQKHLLIAYCVLGTVLSVRNAKKVKKKILALKELPFYRER